MTKETKPRRLKKLPLARVLGISRTTLTKYLDRPGAPRPDSSGAYDVEKARVYCIRRAARAVAGNTTVKESPADKLRTHRLQILTQREEFRFKKEMGEFIEKKRVIPTLDVILANWVKRMRDDFELELPWKYKGKTAIECQQMNIAAIDRIIAGFKEDSLPLTSE